MDMCEDGSQSEKGDETDGAGLAFDNQSAKASIKRPKQEVMEPLVKKRSTVSTLKSLTPMS